MKITAIALLTIFLAHTVAQSDELKSETPGEWAANAAPMPLTTRQQTIRPFAIPLDTQPIEPNDVSQYKRHGYSAWQAGPGKNEGKRCDLMPPGYRGSTNAARLLSFFTMSDVHITDKESPAEVLYFGWVAPFRAMGGLLSQAYSPVVLSTTHVLDAAVKTVNALHRQTPFDFGIVLGDVANSSQYNELRWFIDVLDGKHIQPSSGDHRGADAIAYQKPFKAAGLDSSIPWYQVIGNHDQFWMGVAYPTDKITNAQAGGAILNIGAHLFATNNIDSTGVYVGVVDGTSTHGSVIKAGPASNFVTPPTVVPDTNRLTLTTPQSSSKNFMREFFNTTSSPKGHGFSKANLENNSACYTFQPVANMPIKVIVLDDTVKTNIPNTGPAYCGSGSIDAARYSWLTNELQMGQNAGELMIIATHIPINPQTDLANTTPNPQFSPYPYSYKSDKELIETLHHYPNLILLMAGHRHKNAVTPQLSSDPVGHPEYGFWEVETPSLRDFPQQFRSFDIRRNSDNTISIAITDVDPTVEEGTPAGDSRGYAIGASRLFGNTELADTSSLAYNAELIKSLTPEMQKKIAGSGLPLGRRKQ
jgi:metallophosphoesterase (TIGR03768 family)